MRDHLNFLGDLKKQFNTNGITQEFNNYKKLYKEAIKTAKIQANNNFIHSSTNQSKALWKVINNNRHQKEQNPKNLTITSNEFNEFFSNIAKNIVQNIPQSMNNPLDFLKKMSLTPNTSFNFTEVSFNEVRDIVDNLKNKQSRDLYGFNIKIIKAIKNQIIIPLTKLINICFKQTIFPKK